MNSVALVWMTKTEFGWKRFSVVIGRNGRIKRGAVLIGSKEKSYPEGHFEIRYYEGRKTKYENVGTDATEAINQRDKRQHLGEARVSAAEAGVTLNETEVRKTIKKEGARWVRAAQDRGATEAAEVGRLALDEFQDANPRLTYVDEITADSLVTFWNWLRKHGRSDRTIYNKHERITGFLKFADVDHKKWHLRAPRYEKALPVIYTPEQMELLLGACKRLYHKLLILILVKTGLRDQELQHLCWSDISFAEKKLRVRGKPEYGWKIKDSEQRDIPIPTDLLAMLKEWRTQNPKAKLVLGTSNDRPNTKFLAMLKVIASRAGVADAELHSFRRTYATTLLRGGMDLRTVQMLMGHSDLESTMRYLTPATGDEVRNKIDEILGK
jgi:integrase